MNNKEAIRFIDRLYRDLYLSDDVLHHSTHNRTDKFNNLKEYFDELDDMHKRASTLENRVKILKRLYHERYVIEKEEIPDSFYEMQKEIALEMGKGFLDIDDDTKKKLQEEVIMNQDESIDRWIDYFVTGDGNLYPFWAKYWAFQGMLRLGTYNDKDKVFNKRTKYTTAPFAELNKEALKKTMNLIIKSINKEVIDDEKLNRMVKDGSFQIIYSYFLEKEKSALKKDGIWIKYNKGGDYKKLADSLHGYGTRWCTEGVGTAAAQLSTGDFYVYYTLDKKGDYKVPRLAIRMEEGNIAEIRGILQNQNVEPELKDVLDEKLKEFPDRDKYYQKENNMARLTEIYKKHNNNIELSIDDLRFLYEIDEYIVGFGHTHDPRIREILSKRDEYKDLSKIFNYDVKERSDNYCKCLSMGINMKPDDPLFPKILVGRFPFMEKIEDIVFPDNMRGDIHLGAARSIRNVILPKKVNEDSYDTVGNLSIGVGCVNPVFENVLFPIEMSGDLSVNAGVMKSVRFPRIVHGNVSIKVDNYENIVLPDEVGGTFTLDIKYAKDITLPKRITKGIIILSLGPTVGSLKFPNIGWSVELPEIIYGSGLILPRMLQDDLILSKLTHAEDMVLPETVGGDLNLSGLIDGTNLILPKTIGESVDLRSLSYMNRMILPFRINGNLHISLAAIKYFGIDTFKNIVSGNIYVYNSEKQLISGRTATK